MRVQSLFESRCAARRRQRRNLDGRTISSANGTLGGLLRCQGWPPAPCRSVVTALVLARRASESPVHDGTCGMTARQQDDGDIEGTPHARAASVTQQQAGSGRRGQRANVQNHVATEQRRRDRINEGCTLASATQRGTGLKALCDTFWYLQGLCKALLQSVGSTSCGSSFRTATSSTRRRSCCKPWTTSASCRWALATEAVPSRCLTTQVSSAPARLCSMVQQNGAIMHCALRLGKHPCADVHVSPRLLLRLGPSCAGRAASAAASGRTGGRARRPAVDGAHAAAQERSLPAARRAPEPTASARPARAATGRVGK